MEITETTASNSQEALQDNVKQLHDSGISFSLDDYGTGYSNIERISSMIFDIIKLDKTFVNEADKKHDIVLKHTVSMIKELGMKIVVEGIEDETLLKRFVALGCDYIQGFYFSKPIPKSDFIEFVKNKNLRLKLSENVDNIYNSFSLRNEREVSRSIALCNVPHKYNI